MNKRGGRVSIHCLCAEVISCDLQKKTEIGMSCKVWAPSENCNFYHTPTQNNSRHI